MIRGHMAVPNFTCYNLPSHRFVKQLFQVEIFFKIPSFQRIIQPNQPPRHLHHQPHVQQTSVIQQNFQHRQVCFEGRVFSSKIHQTLKFCRITNPDIFLTFIFSMTVLVMTILICQMKLILMKAKLIKIRQQIKQIDKKTKNRLILLTMSPGLMRPKYSRQVTNAVYSPGDLKICNFRKRCGLSI